MRSAAIAMLLTRCVFAQSAAPVCEPTHLKFAVSKDGTQHPTPSPGSGKAILYFLGAGMFELDGKWMAAVNGSYGFVEVGPGEHHLCAQFQTPLPFRIRSVSAHSLNAAAGSSYYFLAFDNPRSWSDFMLKLLDPDEGARMVAAAKFSTSRLK